MESISVFDIFKIGVGPSSSHTMGPWRAAQRFLAICRERGEFDRIASVRVDLFGSLAKTGKGHGTDIAVLMGLTGEDPVTCDTVADPPQGRRDPLAAEAPARRRRERSPSTPTADLVFHRDETLPFHPNGLPVHGRRSTMGRAIAETYLLDRRRLRRPRGRPRRRRHGRPACRCRSRRRPTCSATAATHGLTIPEVVRAQRADLARRRGDPRGPATASGTR